MPALSIFFNSETTVNADEHISRTKNSQPISMNNVNQDLNSDWQKKISVRKRILQNGIALVIIKDVVLPDNFMLLSSFFFSDLKLVQAYV